MRFSTFLKLIIKSIICCQGRGPIGWMKKHPRLFNVIRFLLHGAPFTPSRVVRPGSKMASSDNFLYGAFLFLEIR